MSLKSSRATALLLSVLLFVSMVPVSVLGEEGMFLPDTLSQLPLDKLKQRGLKIPITDIYNPNGPSIKDAVVTVNFGSGYGTGEFVSPEGLLLTTSRRFRRPGVCLGSGQGLRDQRLCG